MPATGPCRLEPIARSVTLVHRRAAFRAHEHTVYQLIVLQVEVITDAEVTAVSGGDRVDRVEITSEGRARASAPRSGGDRGARFHRQPRPDPRVGHRHRRQPLSAVETTMATSVPGVFAAGDIIDYRGKVRLISVGFGEAATAVNNAAVLVQPGRAALPRSFLRLPARRRVRGGLGGPHAVCHRCRVHRRHRQVLYRGMPGRLHLRRRPQALHQPGRVHRLRCLRAGLSGRGDQPGSPRARRPGRLRRPTTPGSSSRRCPGGTSRSATPAAGH